MQIEQIRAQINEAKLHERKTRVLYRAIMDLARQNGIRLSALHAGKVMDFVTEYVESAPALMQTVEQAAIEHGAQGCIRPLLDAIEEFFLETDDIIPDHFGLAGLLDDAYLAHTLLEAISDRFQSHFGDALLPKEAYESNTFIRRLIGEPFVGILDRHVAETLEGMCNVQEIEEMLHVLERMRLSPVRPPMQGGTRVNELVGVQI